MKTMKRGTETPIDTPGLSSPPIITAHAIKAGIRINVKKIIRKPFTHKPLYSYS